MSLLEQTLEFLDEQPKVQIDWARPWSLSVVWHALLLALLPFLHHLTEPAPLPEIKVLEINILGMEDLALKGTGNDFTVGPMPDKDVMANPPKLAGPVLKGNTAKISKGLAKSKSARAESGPPTLVARGPLFADASSSSIEPGIGREKIYVAKSVTRKYLPSGKGSSGDGEGLVGVPEGPVDLKARRGGGGDGKGTGSYLAGGQGSLRGGDVLMRRGEAIMDYTPGLSDTKGGKTKKRSGEALPPPDDVFFSIRGPLSHRKIEKLNLPKYPRWAEEGGLEAQIQIRLTVSPDGIVMPNLTIEQTSGYNEWDELIKEAVKNMKFKPLPDLNALKEEWGIATFNFKLNNKSSTGGPS